MQLNKHIIYGKKGSTVCYTLDNFRFDTTDSKLKWDDFRFYTPEGKQTDEEGFTYFDVPADEIPIQRDESLNKKNFVLITRDEGVEVLEIMEGAYKESFSVGLEGDVAATALVPSNPDEEIIVDYKEVIGELPTEESL